jgi:hypothetical protein
MELEVEEIHARTRSASESDRDDSNMVEEDSSEDDED